MSLSTEFILVILHDSEHKVALLNKSADMRFTIPLRGWLNSELRQQTSTEKLSLNENHKETTSCNADCVFVRGREPLLRAKRCALHGRTGMDNLDGQDKARNGRRLS